MLNFFNKHKCNVKNGEIQICYDSNKNPIILSEKDRTKNTLIISPFGSGGKSLSMTNIIFQDLQNYNHGMIIMEPLDDLCLDVLSMAKYFDRKVIYFNPILKTCPKFNPLDGTEKEVIDRFICAIKLIYKDSPSYFLDIYESILNRSIKVLKRLYGESVTINSLSKFINNTNGYGMNMMHRLESLNEDSRHEENLEIISWLRTQYFDENSIICRESDSLRKKINEFVSNKYLKDVLTISDESNFCDILDFEKSLENGDILIITSNVDILQDNAKLLSYLLMLQLQTAIVNRKKDDKELITNSIYIDNFQYFNNPEFLDTLITSASKHIIFNLLIQNKDTLLDNFKIDKSYIDRFLTQTFNLIIYPGISESDSKYFTDLLNKYASNKTFAPENLTNKKLGEIVYRVYKDNEFKCGNGFNKYLYVDINEELLTIQKEFWDSCREDDMIK